MQNITYELKYCERCGSLGLRRTQSAETYCEPCGQILLNYSFPEHVMKGALTRKPKREERHIPLQLHGVAQAAWGFGRLQ